MRVVALLALAAAARSAVNTPGLARHVRTPCVTMAARGEPGYKRHRLRKALGGSFGRTRKQDALAASSSDAAPEVAVTALDTARIVAAAADAPTRGRWSAEDTERLSSVELGKVRGNPKDPPNPAAAMRDAGTAGRLLDEMELACCWLLHESARDELPIPRFLVTARPSKILEPELRQMALVLRKALDRDETFAISWDLRKLVPPSLSALNYGQRWMGENAADIERLGESITVIAGSRVTRVCANLCVRACNPPQPVRVCSTEEEALAFAREAHERIARRE